MVKKPTSGKRSAARARTQKVLPDAAPAAALSSKTDRCLTVAVVAVLSTALIEYDSITGDAAAAYAAEDGEWTKQPLGLVSLPDDIAEILSRRRDVSLPRLQELSAGAARHLARVSGSLRLTGLVALSKEAAAALGEFAGEHCSLRDLTQITDEAAEILAENRVISLPDPVRQRAEEARGRRLDTAKHVPEKQLVAARKLIGTKSAEHVALACATLQGLNADEGDWVSVFGEKQLTALLKTWDPRVWNALADGIVKQGRSFTLLKDTAASLLTVDWSSGGRDKRYRLEQEHRSFVRGMMAVATPACLEVLGHARRWAVHVEDARKALTQISQRAANAENDETKDVVDGELSGFLRSFSAQFQGGFLPAEAWEQIQALLSDVLTTLFPARQPPGSEGSAIVNSIGMTLLPVAPGRYLMGSAANDPLSGGAEEFQHAVEITRRVYMGVHQVTQAVYCQLVGSNPSRIQFPTLPVHGLSWQEAAAFCELLTALPDEQAAGRRYRLPSEAEWEYACRAGTDTTFHTGDDLGHQQARFSHNWQATPVPVGSYEPNQWGFFDMHGNVWEWTQDWFASDYYQSSPSKDPMGPSSGSHHTMRGGSAACRARECRSASRGEVFADGPCESPYGKAGELGMRVVCEVAVSPR